MCREVMKQYIIVKITRSLGTLNPYRIFVASLSVTILKLNTHGQQLVLFRFAISLPPDF